jgi:hypothetical protein
MSLETWRRMDTKDAKIERLKALITELALGIDAVQLDTCTQEDWNMLNVSAKKRGRRPDERIRLHQNRKVSL